MKSLLTRLYAVLKDNVTDYSAKRLNYSTKTLSNIYSQFIVTIPCNTDNCDLLAWLKGQHLFPQFYFEQRQQNYTLVTIGQVAQFSDLNQAQNLVLTNPKLLLCGGLNFEQQANFILPRLLLHLENHTLTATLFFNQQNDWLTEQREINACLQTFTDSVALQPIKTDTKLTSESSTQNEWCQLIEQALTTIKQQQLEKVVLAKSACYNTSNQVNFCDFIAASREVNQDCYHFLQATSPSQAFVGSSPECLYARQQQYLETEALAGTAPSVADPTQNQAFANWLLNDQKNCYENQLVAEDIKQSLAPYYENIMLGQRQIRQLRKVQHLYRKISAQLTSNCLKTGADLACLQAIHPTAAVAGLPKAAAIRFIQQYEPWQRGLYAGTVGFLSQAKAEFTVAIRSAKIEQHKIHIFAGAGIVAGSVPLLEWQEIERKASGLTSLLMPSPPNK
ncbi:isochorismate synthase [Mergibacter septicus]|uniref:isochorismate synthase n=1 Tax=Mergibacter septicus TaxID=221402 RepID=UPI0011798567|nr:isochorismate synthase [Mergibacter septicus]AWX14142.1 isochorismate synthase [Mergibacter septicus]